MVKLVNLGNYTEILGAIVGATPFTGAVGHVNFHIVENGRICVGFELSCVRIGVDIKSRVVTRVVCVRRHSRSVKTDDVPPVSISMSFTVGKNRRRIRPCICLCVIHYR